MNLVNNPEGIERLFIDWIDDAAYPCVGAKSALAKGGMKIIVCHSIASAWDDLRIHQALMAWPQEYRSDPSTFRSLVVLFEQPGDLDENAFETALWERLQSLADKDHWLGQDYDPRVSPHPEDSDFSLSFGQEAFFVVGLHPQASRPARRFEYPAMVFNLHDQFERLREESRYGRLKEAILARDKNLAGTINPMLATHGEASEARQYSGRQVSENWRCPFQDPRA